MSALFWILRQPRVHVCSTRNSRYMCGLGLPNRVTQTVVLSLLSKSPKSRSRQDTPSGPGDPSCPQACAATGVWYWLVASAAPSHVLAPPWPSFVGQQSWPSTSLGHTSHLTVASDDFQVQSRSRELPHVINACFVPGPCELQVHSQRLNPVSLMACSVPSCCPIPGSSW